VGEGTGRTEPFEFRYDGAGLRGAYGQGEPQLLLFVEEQNHWHSVLGRDGQAAHSDFDEILVHRQDYIAPPSIFMRTKRPPLY